MEAVLGRVAGTVAADMAVAWIVWAAVVVGEPGAVQSVPRNFDKTGRWRLLRNLDKS